LLKTQLLLSRQPRLVSQLQLLEAQLLTVQQCSSLLDDTSDASKPIADQARS
jgi:hypothetical protein